LNILISIIPIAFIFIIFVIGFVVARKKVLKYNAAAGQTGKISATPAVEIPERKDRIYEKSGVNQVSDHPLGAVQSVIRGRMRFIPFGIMLIAGAFFSLHMLYFTDMEFLVTREPLHMLVATVLMAGAVGWGLQLFYFATCKIKLRRLGFEMCSILGSKGYEYNNADFHLFESIEHKNQSNGYRPMLMKTQTFNWIWICQIFIKSEHKLIELRSSRYAWLHPKITDLTQTFARVD